MYKSTLLLKPATGVDKIIEKMSKKEDIYSALEFSILYLNKFTTENCAKLEENTIDPKGQLDKFIDIANDHISTQIWTIVNLKDINESNKITLNILIEYIKYVKQAKDALIQYLFSGPISIKVIDKLEYLIYKIKTFINTITYLTNLFDADILVDVFKEILSKSQQILNDLETSSKILPTLTNSKLTSKKDWKDAEVKILDMSSDSWKYGSAGKESPYFVDSIKELTIEDKLLDFFRDPLYENPIVVTGSKSYVKMIGKKMIFRNIFYYFFPFATKYKIIFIWYLFEIKLMNILYMMQKKLEYLNIILEIFTSINL